MYKHIYIENFPLSNANKSFSTSRSKLADIDSIHNKVKKFKQELEDWKKQLDKEKASEESPDNISKQSSEENLQESVKEIPASAENINKPSLEQNLEESVKENPARTEKTSQHSSALRSRLEDLILGRNSDNLQEPVKENTGTFIDEAKKTIDELIDKQEKVEEALLKRIEKGYGKLREEASDEIIEKFESRRNKIRLQIEDKSDKLEAEYNGEIKSVDYCQRKLDLEASGFKKYSHILQKEEEEIDNKIKNESYYKNFKDKYDKERAEWKEEHQENIRYCRQEKQEIKKNLESKLEKPSELAESLVDEMGPDYTGGDD